MAQPTEKTPHPSEIIVHSVSRRVEIRYDDGACFSLDFEFLRVYSPSAEVRGHGPGQEVLQTGKRDVTITALEQVGNYAVKPVFSDGHESGIYSWDYLYSLGEQHDALWQDYLLRLADAGASRGDETAAKPVDEDVDAAAAPLQAVEARRRREP